MITDFLYILGIIGIIAQFTTAYFAYKIFSYNRLNIGWLSLVIGFGLQATRRTIELFFKLNGFGIIIDRIIMVSISIFMAWGIWSMLKNFENFEVVEKKVKNKIKGGKK